MLWRAVGSLLLPTAPELLRIGLPTVTGVGTVGRSILVSGAELVGVGAVRRTVYSGGPRWLGLAPCPLVPSPSSIAWVSRWLTAAVGLLRAVLAHRGYRRNNTPGLRMPAIGIGLLTGARS